MDRMAPTMRSAVAPPRGVLAAAPSRRHGASGERRGRLVVSRGWVDGERATAGGAVGLALAALVATSPFNAHALGPVKITLTNPQVERIACQDGTDRGTKGGTKALPKADSLPLLATGCIQVTADADNPAKQVLNNADVFAKVYDKFGNPTMDVTENIRLSYIGSVPPGKSQVRFFFKVPGEQLETSIDAAGKPVLELRGLKASGFKGGVMPGQGNGIATGCDEFTAPEDCEELPFYGR